MDQDILNQLIENNSVALRYVDENGDYANLQFPYNPNGSIYDLAALSDKSGRVLALMPHPERGIFLLSRTTGLLKKKNVNVQEWLCQNMVMECSYLRMH